MECYLKVLNQIDMLKQQKQNLITKLKPLQDELKPLKIKLEVWFQDECLKHNQNKDYKHHLGNNQGWIEWESSIKKPKHNLTKQRLTNALERFYTAKYPNQPSTVCSDMVNEIVGYIWDSLNKDKEKNTLSVIRKFK